MAFVWQISVLHLYKGALLSGVLLKDKPVLYNKQISSIRNLRKVFKSYLTNVCDQTDITILFDHKTIHTKTNEHGGFSIALDFIPKGDCKIRLTEESQDLEILQTYPVVFKETDSSFDVISDIDDTIIYSYTASFFKRIGTLVFSNPEKRKPIKFTQDLLEVLKKHKIRVFYVSKSESNLFNMLTAFIEHNNLPKGPLILTPYLKFAQLFKSKEHNFKLEHIQFIIKNTGNKKFVLFGDDSQKDMEIYTHIVKEFPKRILKVYIRQTKPQILPYQKQMWEKLKSTHVPFDYFKAEQKLNIEKEITQLKNSIL